MFKVFGIGWSVIGVLWVFNGRFGYALGCFGIAALYNVADRFVESLEKGIVMRK